MFRSIVVPLLIFTLNFAPLSHHFVSAQELPMPPSMGTPAPGNVTPSVNGQSWNLSTLSVQSSDNVALNVSIAPDFNPAVTAVLQLRDECGTFEYSLVSNDGFESVQVSGIVSPNGEMIIGTRRTNVVAALGTNAGAAAWAAADSTPGFWAGYWHYLTNPSEMDDDLEYAFYGAVGTAAVAGTAAGGLYVVGVNPVLWGGGAAATGTAEAAAAATAALIARHQVLLREAQTHLAYYLNQATALQNIGMESPIVQERIAFWQAEVSYLQYALLELMK